MTYVYLILFAVFGAVWAVYFLLRRDLRRKLLFSSLISLPLGLTEPIFIPGYWVPQFKVIPLGEELFLESLLFCSVLGGFAATSYQVILGKKIFRLGEIHPALTLTAPAIFLPVYLPGGTQFYGNIAFYVAGSMLAGSALLICRLGRGAVAPILLSGVVATLLYTGIYLVFWHSFPELRASYQLRHFSGVSLGGLPVEEYLWIFAFACYWAPLYEIWRSRFPRL